MTKFEQFLRDNPGKYPGVLKKVQAEKKRLKVSKREANKRALWAHGIRANGPPI